MSFKEGRHIANHFSNAKIFTNKTTTLDTLEYINNALRSGQLKSSYFTSIEQFTPLTFRLDIVADLVKFLNTSSDGYWLVKHSHSNQGRGIEMVRDAAAYKEALLTKKDKWGDN